ncbi:hypothetical protein BU16DRAFT_557624 [Lophium mytilinum]|uniref:SAGA-associated factor 11 n=1 Tax=Lophium mytilinum TaxID=390894 RepID=A0A6A6R6E1_9PEZI|nr:hypothetical protein BU16DRAFT_557624 [Lophium mytilinum]
MFEDGPAELEDLLKSGVQISPATLDEVTKHIFEDVLYDVMSSIALSCHRSEKLLRMSSAATQVESLAVAQLDSQPSAKTAHAPPLPPPISNDAASWDGQRVHLKGNPLKTTTEIICPHCKLPRLKYPASGKGAQAPDLTKEYCNLHPWVQRPGHDVYGNLFPTDMAKSKKERELQKQQLKNADKESVGTPGSQDTDMTGEPKLNTGGKPAHYIPWHTCPNCKRSLLITRFAQHLEKCLGINGRQSSRNAMAKLTGQNGNGSGMGNTPLGSRMGTPVPASQGSGAGAKDKRISPVKRGGDDDDGDDNETPEKKKKKKSSYVKKADRGGKDGTLKVKLKTSKESQEKEAAIAAKRLPRPAESGSGVSKAGGEGKRDRDGDADESPRKKLKLTLSKEDSSLSEIGSNGLSG